MAKTKNETVVLDKAPQVAFCSMEGCHVRPVVKENGRVVFSVTGDVSEALAKLSSNPAIPILDFLNRLETVRSVIFSLKGQGVS